MVEFNDMAWYSSLNQLHNHDTRFLPEIACGGSLTIVAVLQADVSRLRLVVFVMLAKIPVLRPVDRVLQVCDLFSWQWSS